MTERKAQVQYEAEQVTEHELCCSNEFTSTEPLQPLPIPKTKDVQLYTYEPIGKIDGG